MVVRRRRRVSITIPWFWIIIIISIIYNVANKDDDKKTESPTVSTTVERPADSGTISQGEPNKQQMEEAVGKAVDSLSQALQAVSERVKDDADEFFAKKKQTETSTPQVEEATKSYEEKPVPVLEAEKPMDNSDLKSLDDANSERTMKKL